jgi:glycosyltransferase involved in cell wall biosynthesis
MDGAVVVNPRHALRTRGRQLEQGFSVVIATKNRRQFLSHAVEAAMANTERPFELIIMDNAGDEGTSEICQMPEAHHPCVVRHLR